MAKKFVSRNDIRAQILRMPDDVKLKTGSNISIVLYFDEQAREVFNIDKTGTYVGGVIRIFKKYRLVDSDGQSFPQNSVWEEFQDGFMVKFRP